MATQKQINSLPSWARKIFENDQATINRLKNKIERLENVAAIVNGREWFTVSNPITSGKDVLSLWEFSDSQRPFCVCTLGKDDVLVIGKAK